MASRKNRPVLYELVSHGGQPQAWPAPGPQTGTPSQPSSGPEQPGAAPTEDLFTSPRPAHATLRIVNGRVVLDLAWPYLAAVGVLLVVVLIATYHAGARSVHPPSPKATDVQAVLRGKSDSEPPAAEPVAPRPTPQPGRSGPVVTPRTPVPAEPPPETPPPAEAKPAEHEEAASFALRPGYSYVVVQHLSKRPAGVQAGEKIREFLTAKGIATVVRPGSGDLEVLVAEPFLTKQGDGAAAAHEKERARQLVERIKKLGQEFNLVGGYSFDKCYLREP